MTWYTQSPARPGGAWPTPQDYNEALQNPTTSFDDPELKRGRADLGAHGIPKAITGNFASVYRVQTGKAVHAVRCFLRNVPDQQHRYELISQHLSAVKLPQAVEFAFIEHGVRVAGRWYPVLKMDWVPGVTLASYVEQHVHDRGTLKRLPELFVELLDDLRQREIAHGDLQHGNLLVVDGRGGPHLKVIDYDGMWVPTLDGGESNELGHPNHQHPMRQRSEYGPTLDSFSAWVILASLLAVRSDLSAWSAIRPDGADDRLLLGKADYLKPAASVALARLGRSRDAATQHAAEHLLSFCPPKDRVLGLPAPTDEDLRGASLRFLPDRLAPPLAAATAAGKEWLKEQAAQRTTERTRAGRVRAEPPPRVARVHPAGSTPVPAVAPSTRTTPARARSSAEMPRHSATMSAAVVTPKPPERGAGSPESIDRQIPRVLDWMGTEPFSVDDLAFGLGLTYAQVHALVSRMVSLGLVEGMLTRWVRRPAGRFCRACGARVEPVGATTCPSCGVPRW